jgi:hypothetical protein
VICESYRAAYLFFPSGAAYGYPNVYGSIRRYKVRRNAISSERSFGFRFNPNW